MCVSSKGGADFLNFGVLGAFPMFSWENLTKRPNLVNFQGGGGGPKSAVSVIVPTTLRGVSLKTKEGFFCG